ncbi:hypothetical protein SBV1_2540028 [Verrucomicrobia bacterium]|nr:hypothetical protein SBV1_2540028 [Verrucomicrobiota bacterium]
MILSGSECGWSGLLHERQAFSLHLHELGHLYYVEAAKASFLSWQRYRDQVVGRTPEGREGTKDHS